MCRDASVQLSKVLRHPGGAPKGQEGRDQGSVRLLCVQCRVGFSHTAAFKGTGALQSATIRIEMLMIRRPHVVTLLS